MDDIILSTGEIIESAPAVGLVSTHISARAYARVGLVPGGVQVRRWSLSPVPMPVGAARGRVAGFSSASRSRLIRKLMLLDWSELIGGKHSEFVDASFVTLTYPDVFPGAWQRWKRDLKAFCQRLQRKYTDIALIWKLEEKERLSGQNKGEIAPHFHCLVVFPHSVELSAFRSWLAQAWYEVCDTGDLKHLSAGTGADRVYGTVSKLMAYLSKYLAKEFETEAETGRCWGEIGELPYGEEYVVNVDYAEFLRRVRRWGSGSSFLRSRSVFCSGFVVFGSLAGLLRGVCVGELPNLESLSTDYTLKRQKARFRGRQSWHQRQIVKAQAQYKSWMATYGKR